jgi:ABC-type sugar transport system substrate-binding protein
MELGAAQARKQGGLMATVTHVFTVDYVAQMLGEHPDLIQAIISNDDNLAYGAIIAVCTEQEEAIDALTPDGVDELASMLKSARLTPESWQQFLDDFVADPEIIESVKPLNPR